MTQTDSGHLSTADAAPVTPDPVNAHAMRRALARADAGKQLNADEVAVLIRARGEDLQRLMALAARVRDRAFGDRITYSP